MGCEKGEIVNRYHVTEKKPEHGGGWAFMQHNRREGSIIICDCGAGGWVNPGHATAEEAERCFYEYEKAKGIRWSTQSQASKCAICGEWTPDTLHGAGHLIDPSEDVCRSHFPDDEEASTWLWDRHPFWSGIQITASW